MQAQVDIGEGGECVRVLAVDDDPLARYALAAVLESTGAELVFAASGEEALERIGDGGYAAVILDIGMPGLDGFGTCDRGALVEQSGRNRRRPRANTLAAQAA